METYNTKIRPWIGIIALFGIGTLMLAMPELFMDVEATGRKAFTKLILGYVWGIPAGVIAILAGGYLSYAQFKKQFIPAEQE